MPDDDDDDLTTDFPALSDVIGIRAADDHYPVLLPPEMVDDVTRSELSGAAMVTYALLVRLHGGYEDVQTHSRDSLAHLRGVAKRTLQRHLKELEQRGWLVFTEEGVMLLLNERKAA